MINERMTENCPECQTPVIPIDKKVAFKDSYGTYPVRQWFYNCANVECGWTWANEIQRENNSKFYKQSRKQRQFDLLQQGVGHFFG